MHAEVLAVNRCKQFAAVRTSQGITVFAWENNDLVEGDVISGNLDDLEGEKSCFNTTRGTRLNVVVVASQCSDDGAVQLLFV